jgi:hypothetical protein
MTYYLCFYYLGDIPMNYELLRKAVKLCRLLPAGGSAVGMPQQCETDIPNVSGMIHFLPGPTVLWIHNIICCVFFASQEVTDSLALSMLGTIASNLGQLRDLHGNYQHAYARKDRPGPSRLR